MTVCAWVWVAESSDTERAMPKSATLTCPADVSRTLAGLMSR